MGYYSHLEGEIGFKEVKNEDFPALTDFLFEHFGFQKEDFVLKDGQVETIFREVWGDDRKMHDLEERLIELKNTYQLTHLSLEHFGEEIGDIERYHYYSEPDIIGVYHPEIKYKFSHGLK